MADIHDIGVSAAINLLSALAFLVAFAILRLQPINDRVYFPKWYLKGLRAGPSRPKGSVTKVVNLDFRILKIFVPIMALSFAVLLPINLTGKMLDGAHDLTFSKIDKLSISNIQPGSNRFWAHLCVAYASTFWTCYMLYKEYKIVTTMRLQYIAAADRRPDQFSVLVRNVPPDSDESVSEHVEHFFCVNHPDQYLSHQVVYNANKLAKLVDTKKSVENWLIYYENKYEREPSRKPTIKTGFWGLWGPRMDAIDYYTKEIEKLCEQEAAEREKVMSDPESILPSAFVSFKSRWGAAVCAQTQQSSNPTQWLTEWAPEPRDVYWNNLAIPYVEHNVRRLLMAVALFFLIFFFMVPITFVQSLANIDGIEKVLPFLKNVVEKESVNSFIQGYLPAIILKIFLILIPMVIMLMSKIEGFTSYSYLERRSASKYHFFILVNVFLGSIIAGTAFQQLHRFLNQSPTEIPIIIGASIPMKATFFITYVMVDGWAGVAAEVLRLVPLVLFHIKNAVLVKTEKDREAAMDPGFLDFPTYEPRIQLYFLLGLVYCAVTPIILPFIIVFFAFAYLVFRHQDAMMKDTLERATDPTLNIRTYLRDAYLHPIFKGGEMFTVPPSDEEEGLPLVATKRSQRSSRVTSIASSEASV